MHGGDGAVQVVFGAASMPVSQLIKLGRGAVVALDRKVGDPVDIVVNGRVVARGDIVVVDEETSRLGCQIVISDALDGLIVRLPAGSRNMLLD